MDGVIESKYHYQAHTEVMTHETSQPTEDLILDRNAEMRKNPGSVQDLGAQGKDGTWGRQIAEIPMIMYAAAIKAGYELTNPDQKFAASEMQRYLASSEGQKCLIQGKRHGR